MSSYKNNKDGTLSSIATNNHITQITQPEQYVTEAELVEGLSSKQDIIQYATLPTASSDELGKVYQYVGATTADYTHGYIYECVTDGTDYSWERINVQPSSGGGTSDYDDLTNKPQVEGITLVGNKTASDLGLATAASLNAKQDKMQFTTMPTASAVYLDKIVQFVGTTTANYTYGYFYKCVNNGGVYSWERVDVQPNDVDYTDVNNKPQINGVTLSGNKSSSDLGIITNTVDNLVNYYSKSETYNKTEVNNTLSDYVTTSNLTTLLADKQNIIQYSTVPTASATLLNSIIQYVGTTNANYTNGYFYKCISDGGNPATYGWERIDIQPNGSGDMLTSVYDPNGTVADAGGIVEYIESIGDNIPHYTTMPTDVQLLAMPNKTVFETDGYWTQSDGHGGKYMITTNAYLVGGMLRITDGTTTKYLVALENDNNLLSGYIDPTRYGVREATSLAGTLTPSGTYATANSDIMSRITNHHFGSIIKFPSGKFVFESPLDMSTRQYSLIGVSQPITRTTVTGNYEYDLGTILAFPFLTNGQTAIGMAGGSTIENIAIYGNKNTYSFEIDRDALITTPQSVITETIAESGGTQIKCKAINKSGGGQVKNVFVFNFYTGITCSGNTFIKDFYARQVHYGISCDNDTKMEGIGGFDVHTLIRIEGSLCSVLHERVDSCVHALEIVNGGSHTITDVDGDWCTDSLIAIGDGTTYGTVRGVVFDSIHGRCNTLKSYDSTQQTTPIDVRELADTDGYGLIRVYPRVNFTDSRIVANSCAGGNPMDSASNYLTPDILFTFASNDITNLGNLTFVLAKGIYNKNDILRIIQTRQGFTARFDDASGVYFIEGSTVTTYGESESDLPTGGTTGQVLAKHSNADYDTEWINVSGASGVTRLELDADYEDMGLIHDISEYESIGVVNVKDYGAVGDGVTDDSAAIIAAGLAASQSTPIKPIIYFPRGTYNLGGSNGTTIYTTSEYTLAGESKDFVTLTNSNIRADYGINCRDITFDGGTLRDLSSSGLNQALRVNTVTILCLPVENQDIEINYYNCEFKNAQIASLAYAYNESTKRISSMTVEGCYFHDLEHCGIYHTCDIGVAKISNNKFKNLGSDTLLEGSFACIRLGDTSNNTPADVDACYILNNEFDTFQSGYDYSGIMHNIAFNMLMIEAWEVVITNNIFKDLLGWGGDREAVYTKARYAEISDNIIINGCCGGEGAIACKPRHFDAYPDRNTNIHDNTIIAPWGNGIAVYGAGSIFNNKISIAHISRAIRCYGNWTDDENSIGTMDICNNNIIGGIGNLDVNGTTVNYPAIVVAEGATPPTVVPIISATDYPYKVTINDNMVCITRDDGLTARPIAIACENMRYDIDVKYNDIETSYVGNNAITVGSNSSSKNPVTGRKNLNINIEGNSISDQSTPIYMNLSGSKIASQRKIVNVINNSIRSTTSYPTIIQATPNGNDIVIYRTIYNTNTQSGSKRHLYVKDMKYIYVEDAQYVTIDSNNVTPYEIKLLDTAPVVSVYNDKALIDNVTVFKDANLLHVPDGEYSGYGLTISVKDNIMTLNASTTSNNLYVKLTNGVEIASASIPTTWKSQTVDFMPSGGTYGLRDFVFGGVTYKNTVISNVRDSNGNILMSYARTNPQTLSTTPSCINLFIPKSSILINYQIGVSITKNTIAEDWGSFIAYHDYWKKYVSHFTLNTDDFIVPSTGERYTQGMCSDGTYMYISAITGTDTDNTIIYKYNLSDGTLVDSVNSYSLGHCNSMTYCSKDNKIYCIALDTNGQTIHKINTDLTYDSSFTVNLTPFYSASTGVGAISYNAKRNQFVCLIRGTQKGFAIFDTRFNLLDIVWTTSIYNQSGLATYGSIFADDDFIYQVTYSLNGIYVFTWQGELVGKVQIPDALDVSGSGGSTYNPELEDLEIVNGYGYINYTELNTKKISVIKLNILDKRYACVVKK